MLSESRLVLQNLLCLELLPALGLEVERLDEVEVSSTNSSSSCPVNISLGLVDSVRRKGRWWTL